MRCNEAFVNTRYYYHEGFAFCGENHTFLHTNDEAHRSGNAEGFDPLGDCTDSKKVKLAVVVDPHDRVNQRLLSQNGSGLSLDLTRIFVPIPLQHLHAKSNLRDDGSAQRISNASGVSHNR
ncbi:hypothetical protein EGR_02495 [Echinococcus granulosus]|uniref:Uncharacterized protein n=1 Tax=Echinococcus granulosus TaxID=6210 RepID=W6V872_ECHGR|nr:hypothetical protein EGR_02495 [Echinococcus granulosus]EUB62699.1 hypothetical protein EGR_02495 [Echinococcus granulosus]